MCCSLFVGLGSFVLSNTGTRVGAVFWVLDNVEVQVVLDVGSRGTFGVEAVFRVREVCSKYEYLQKFSVLGG